VLAGCRNHGFHSPEETPIVVSSVLGSGAVCNARTCRCWSTPIRASSWWRAAVTRGRFQHGRVCPADSGNRAGVRHHPWAASLRRFRFGTGLEGCPAALGPAGLPARRALHRDRGRLPDSGAGRAGPEARGGGRGRGFLRCEHGDRSRLAGAIAHYAQERRPRLLTVGIALPGLEPKAAAGQPGLS
jgi:hypothetical protein